MMLLRIQCTVRTVDIVVDRDTRGTRVYYNTVLYYSDYVTAGRIAKYRFWRGTFLGEQNFGRCSIVEVFVDMRSLQHPWRPPALYVVRSVIQERLFEKAKHTKTVFFVESV